MRKGVGRRGADGGWTGELGNKAQELQGQRKGDGEGWGGVFGRSHRLAAAALNFSFFSSADFALGSWWGQAVVTISRLRRPPVPARHEAVGHASASKNVIWGGGGSGMGTARPSLWTRRSCVATRGPFFHVLLSPVPRARLLLAMPCQRARGQGSRWPAVAEGGPSIPPPCRFDTAVAAIWERIRWHHRGRLCPRTAMRQY